MHSVLLIIFIASAYLILHSYVVYPAFLLLFSSKGNKKLNKFTAHDDLPEVAILMAAYNEEKVIGEKIASVFNTNYPIDKIKFYIGSDASCDNTDAIIEEWRLRFPTIKLIRFGGRTGKSGIINQLSDMALEPIFILTDANVFFKEDTIFNLVRHFKNEKTAQVCANIIKVSNSAKGIASQEKSYIALENKIKFQESVRWNIVMGAEGGCYAIRKNSFAKVPPKFFMDDFYITLNVIEQRQEIVFDNDAICNEDVPTEAAEEFKRKVRISIGNFQNLMRYKKLLIPRFNGVSFAFFSHKVFRWLTPFLLLFCFLSTIGLLNLHPAFKVLLIIQLLGFFSPLTAYVFPIKISLLKYISHFYLMNFALLKGFVLYAKGVKSNVWQPTKREVN